MKTLDEVCDDLCVEFNKAEPPYPYERPTIKALMLLQMTMAEIYGVKTEVVSDAFHAAQDRYEEKNGIENSKKYADVMAEILCKTGLV